MDPVRSKNEDWLRRVERPVAEVQGRMADVRRDLEKMKDELTEVRRIMREDRRREDRK